MEERTEPVDVSFHRHRLAVLESRHGARFRMAWRDDPFHKLLLVWEGAGTVAVDGPPSVSNRIEAPCLVRVPASTRHRLSDDARRPLSLFGVCLDRPPLPEAGLLGRAFAAFGVFRGDALVAEASHLFRRILYEQRVRRSGWEDVQLSLACLLLARLGRRTTGAGAEVAAGRSPEARIRDYLGELEETFWLSEPMDAVAARLGMSRRNFSKCFRKVAGESWLRHIRGLRVRHAAELLRTTDLPVKTVAFECGFGDPAGFHRCFREAFGTTPGGFREGAEG